MRRPAPQPNFFRLGTIPCSAMVVLALSLVACGSDDEGQAGVGTTTGPMVTASSAADATNAGRTATSDPGVEDASGGSGEVGTTAATTDPGAGSSTGGPPIPPVGCDGAVIPAESDWVDQGEVLIPGPANSWDIRLNGMISPSAATKIGDTFYLYYVGADGDRSTDGGPRHRAFGVATSADGLTFTKHVGNPILTYLPNNNEEEGVFSGAVVPMPDGLAFYYSTLDAGNMTSEQVDSDISLATSANGLDFDPLGDVIVNGDNAVWGNGDELFPVGAYSAGGTWHVYYIAKGGGVQWGLGVASGPALDDFSTFEPIFDDIQVIGGSDVVVMGTEVAVFMLRDFSAAVLEVRTAPVDDPASLGEPVEVYDFDGLRHATVYLDCGTGTWWMYYLRDGDSPSIYAKNVLAR